MTRIRPTSPAAIAEAARILRAGGLVAFPTETVYGLGADATNDRAVAAIFDVKERPRFNPLIIHVADVDAARRIVDLDARSKALAARFWPGPLSLVLPRCGGCPVSLLAGAGLDTLAVRAPDGETALSLIRAADRPIAAPSANRSGTVSPTMARHVADSLDDADVLVLDGGPCRIGVESTVLDLSGEKPALLRSGGTPLEELEPMIGPIDLPRPSDTRSPASPGMLTGHYAPQLPLRFDIGDVRPGEALLSFGQHRLTGFAAEKNLSPAGDLTEAAANLFAFVRELDDAAYAGIAAMAVPEGGLGRAINDRLRRAAAERLAGGRKTR